MKKGLKNLSESNSKLDALLKVLSDGKWHGLNELFHNHTFPKEKKTELEEFLEECKQVGLIETDGYENGNPRIRGTNFCKKIMDLPTEENQ